MWIEDDSLHTDPESDFAAADDVNEKRKRPDTLNSLLLYVADCS